MKLNKYPDGTSYINKTELSQQVFRLNSYEELWYLKQFVDAFHSNYNIGKAYKIIPNIIIPNLLEAQADRRFNKGESFGLKLVLQELVKMEANFSIFHPHNSEVVEMAFEMYDKNVKIIDNTEFIEDVLSDLYLVEHNLILMSSDAGGFKPLMKLADKLEWKGETESASKSRKYEDGKSKLIQKVDRQDFNGKDILIIDDLCVYGGTFIGLAKMLKERNCGKLYLAVSHLTVENPNPELFTLFDKVFTTNSKYDEYFPIPHKDGGGASKPENLKVINLF